MIQFASRPSAISVFRIEKSFQDRLHHPRTVPSYTSRATHHFLCTTQPAHRDPHCSGRQLFHSTRKRKFSKGRRLRHGERKILRRPQYPVLAPSETPRVSHCAPSLSISLRREM